MEQNVPALSLRPNPNPSAPLTALLCLSDGPASAGPVTVTAESGRERFERVYAHPAPGSEVPVVGFGFGRTYTVTARAPGLLPCSLTFSTPPAPAGANDFFELAVTAREGMQPGWILFNPRRQVPTALSERERGFIDDAALRYGCLVLLDMRGDIVWYYTCADRITYFTVHGEHIYYGTASSLLCEIDFAGNLVQRWGPSRRPSGRPLPPDVTPVDAETFHHQFLVLDSGNFLALSTQQRLVDDFYTSEDDPAAPRAPQYVVGDVLVEFERSGRVVWTWNAFDHLDVRRIGYETFVKYWGRRGYDANARDWTHFNSLCACPGGDAFLVNSRLQSSVYKIDRRSGEIEWIFGQPDGYGAAFASRLFTLTAGEWPWEQHAAYLSDAGELVLFNNDNYQAWPFHPIAQPRDVDSRAAAYALDCAHRTARQVWNGAVPGEAPVCSTAMGSVSALAGRRVLVNYGMLLDPAAAADITWDTREKYPTWTLIREMEMREPPRVLFEARITRRPGSAVGWQSFGAAKLTHLPGADA